MIDELRIKRLNKISQKQKELQDEIFKFKEIVRKQDSEIIGDIIIEEEEIIKIEESETGEIEVVKDDEDLWEIF